MPALQSTGVPGSPSAALRVHPCPSPQECSAQLYRELFKFVHRSDVGILQRELPPLHEYVVRTPLSPLQAKVYTNFLNQSLKHCTKATNLQTQRILYLSAVLYKCGNHPDLVVQGRKGSGEGCSVPMDAFEGAGDWGGGSNLVPNAVTRRKERGWGVGGLAVTKRLVSHAAETNGLGWAGCMSSTRSDGTALPQPWAGN